jgi:methyl-accepting chemotaxis protein
MSGYRPLIVAANRDQLPHTGISVARGGPAVFAVAPVDDGAGNHLGIFEVGIDIGPVIEGLKASYEIDLGFFVNEELLRRVALDAPPEIFNEENRVGQYLRVYATHSELIKALAHSDDLDGLEESRRVVYQALGEDYGVLLVPIRDPAGLPLGVMLVAENFAETRAAAGRSLVWQGLIALFGIALLSGAVLVVLRGFLLQPIREIVAGNAVDDEVLCDELRELSKGYAELRAQVEPNTQVDEGRAP